MNTNQEVFDLRQAQILLTEVKMKKELKSIKHQMLFTGFLALLFIALIVFFAFNGQMFLLVPLFFIAILCILAYFQTFKKFKRQAHALKRKN